MALRIVAQYADTWHSFSDVETLERKIGVLQEWCDKVGRDMSEIEISTGVKRTHDGTLGSLESIEAQYALGARLFTLGISSPDLDLSQARELVAWRDRMNAA